MADGNIQVRRSDDGVDWEYAGEVWQEKPAWLTAAVPGVDNLWAPELYEHDGTWYLYYSASTFGKNLSVIALATNTTLDPADPGYEWVDRGAGDLLEGGTVQRDRPRHRRGRKRHAVDVASDRSGPACSWWSSNGPPGCAPTLPSRWPSPTGKRRRTPSRRPTSCRTTASTTCSSPATSAARALDSTYNIAVGRSDSITGPYVDADGKELLDGGGTPVLATDGGRVGPGGQSVSGNTLAFHYYAEEFDGAFRLGLAELEWKDGWPTARWE